MAVYRNIHISFWEDTKVLDDMEIEERYFMLYLLTNPHSNQVGCFEISKRQMIAETGFNKEKINKLLKKFENDLEIISYCEKTKELFIKNWFKYNWTKSPKVRICIENELDNIKSVDLKGKIQEIYTKIYGIDSVSKDYTKTKQSLGIKEEKEKEKEKEKEEEEESVAKATSLPPLIFDLPLILDFGLNRGADKEYCKKFYEYYKNKKWESSDEWKSKFDEWCKKDNIEPNIYQLKKISEGAFQL